MSTARTIFEKSQNCKEGSRDVTRCLVSFPEGTLRTSEERISPCEDVWYGQKQQEESAEEEGRRKKPSLLILHARCASRSQRDEMYRMEQVDEVRDNSLKQVARSTR